MSYHYPSPRAAKQTCFTEKGLEERGSLEQARREVQVYTEVVRQTASCPYPRRYMTKVKLSTVLITNSPYRPRSTLSLERRWHPIHAFIQSPLQAYRGSPVSSLIYR